MPSECVERVLARLEEGARQSGDGWTARCPAHDDRKASLRISEGADGKVLLKCFAGCDPSAIVAKLGLTLADLFADRPKDQTPKAAGKITLADLARDKGLPVDFLKALGLHDLPHGGVGVPYKDATGHVVETKRRTA
ncbi:MAG: hypothetical protein V2A77_09140, partial [Pseudomonadota bacterium]